MKNPKIILLFLLALTSTVSCSEDPAIPKLAPPKHYQTTKLNEDAKGVLLKAPEVDVLFVVDGSGSMKHHQSNLEKNIELFLNELLKVNLDYRIAVTISGYRRDPNLTDVYPDRLTRENSGLFHTPKAMDIPPHFITSSTPMGTEILRERLLVGTDNDYEETFFQPVLDAFDHAQSSPQNLGFFRNSAYFVPIFITDTEDQTEDTFGSTAYLDPSEFFYRLSARKVPRELIIPYSVHIPSSYGISSPQGCGQRDAGGVNRGVPLRIEEFMALAGGVVYDICSKSFGEELAQIGKDLVNKVGGILNLEMIPDPSTIEIYFGDYKVPQDSENGWYYDPHTNSIRLGAKTKLPDNKDAQLTVEYLPANQFHK